MGMLDRDEVYSIVNSDFFKELLSNISLEILSIKEDVYNVSYDSPEAMTKCLKYKSQIEGIERVLDIIKDLKQKSKGGAEGEQSQEIDVY